jgi:hypothetical protein
MASGTSKVIQYDTIISGTGKSQEDLVAHDAQSEFDLKLSRVKR